MKNKGILIALAIIGVIALIMVAIALGTFWGRGWFRGGCSQGFDLWNNSLRFGRGMMWNSGPRDIWQIGSSGSQLLSIEETKKAVNDYIAGYSNSIELQIKEIMLFDNHAYVMIVEKETGIGAFEVLVDPDTKNVFPEMGPNMMWNLKYGPISRGMMGGGYYSNTIDLPITGEEAIDFANTYLNRNNSDLTAGEHPDRFYGYYTIHTLRNGEIVGMLSVNGFDGGVFLHTWHGDFVELAGYEDESSSD